MPFRMANVDLAAMTCRRDTRFPYPREALLAIGTNLALDASLGTARQGLVVPAAKADAPGDQVM